MLDTMEYQELTRTMGKCAFFLCKSTDRGSCKQPCSQDSIKHSADLVSDSEDLTGELRPHNELTQMSSSAAGAGQPAQVSVMLSTRS